jgi:CxxC motif-containing protein (DUF1111 family)
VSGTRSCEALAAEWTVADRSAEAFGHPLAGLGEAELRRFAFGNRLFETSWVVAPGSVATLDGLGPLYNRVSCAGCHVRDGRGGAPAAGEPPTSMLVRVFVQPADERGGPQPHPRYGLQIQDRAIPGFAAEARIELGWVEREGRYADGETYSLREPRLTLADPAHGPLEQDVALALRVSPPIFGSGLLEAIPASALAALEDEADADGDGVSGRLNLVRHEGDARALLGRFGWKAGEPTVRRQVATALARDIGITSSVFPVPDAAAGGGQPARAAAGEPEISDEFLDRLVFYVQNLAVPSPRDRTAVARRGEELFRSVGCAACHVTPLPIADHPALGDATGVTIAPYSDLLLHDMGPGLADGSREFRATGNEWRTPPLWGLGLATTVNRRASFLHDGRARTPEEAILWHGGEAARARSAFEHLARDERRALLSFLGSL